MHSYYYAHAIAIAFAILTATPSHGQNQNAPGGFIQNGPNNQGTIINNNTVPQVYTVCSGEYERACQAHDAYLYCYSDVQAWANARCGSSIVQRVNTYGGNRCGYAIDRVICTNPK